MDWWKRYPGDYARDTADLTLAEHGAYVVLLDAAYATEAALPPDRVYTVARALTRPERAAVDRVLARFWRLDSDGWRNPRAEREIDGCRRMRAGGAKRARERWGGEK